MVCSPDTIKSVKAMRADLNRDYAELEKKRKSVRAAILKPYEDFEGIYKFYVSDPHRLVDAALKGKIESVECELKGEKQKELETYFEELCEAENIDFLSFHHAGLSVTLSASMKSMKEDLKHFVSRIKEDICIINTMKSASEYRDEYTHNGFRLYEAISAVDSRRARISALEAQKTTPEGTTASIEEKAEEKVERFSPPVEIDDKEYTVSFKVTATKAKLTELKRFLENGGYTYDN